MPGYKLFVLFGLLMCLVKPFAGFSLCNKTATFNKASILVKSFTKRKQEFVENSEYDILTIQRQLSQPGVLLSLLSFFFFFATGLFFSIKITTRILADRHAALYSSQPLYLLGGKLTV